MYRATFYTAAQNRNSETRGRMRTFLSLFLVGVFDGLLRFGCLLVFLGEPLDAAGRIDQLLLAREEGMAIGADFDAQELALHCRSRGERVPAGAMHGYRVVVRMNVRFHGRSPAGWPVCAAPGQASGVQSRRLVSGQFSIIRDSPGPANMIYMRAGIRLDAQPGTNDSPMEHPTCREAEKMPIQSKVNSIRWPLLRMGAVLILVSCGLAGRALAQEPAAHDMIYVVSHVDIIPPETAAGTKLVQQYVGD